MAEYIQVKCFEVNQPIGTFYVGTINWKDLLLISFADIRRLGNERSLDNYLGIQRELSPKRVEELKKYVNTVDATFPTSVILAVESDVAEFDPKRNVLKILADKEAAKIIDGQHRIKGPEGFEGDKDFEVNVTVFVDLEIEDQAMVFATINLAQTKVNKSLVYDLYEYTKQRSPQKTSHNIVRILNSKEGSPFYKRIKILGSATPGLKQTITQATFVEALLRYVSGNPSRAFDDRDILKRGESPDPATNCQRQLEMDMATIRNAHGMGAYGVLRGLAPAALHTPKKI
jgi:DGQHR domain-containing protein